jgi:ABC-type multidrug transport system, ATPase and permease components
MGYLKPYWMKYRVKYLLAVFFLAFEALADLSQPAMMAQIVDQGVARSNLSFIEKYGLLMLLITLGGAVCASMRNILSVVVSQNFAMDLRKDLYVKIQQFSMRNIDHFGSATLITRLTNDVTRIQTFANGLMRMMLKAPLVGIGSLIMAVNLNLKLSLILLAVVPVIALLIFLNMKLSYPLFRSVQRAIDQVNLSVQEYLSGVRVVKVFNRSVYEKEKFQKKNQRLSHSSAAAAKVGSLFGPLINLSVNFGIVAILWFGGLGVNGGTIHIGSIIALTNYMMQILFAIMVVNNAFNLFVRARASAERIGEVMQSKTSLSFPETDRNPKSREGTLAFKQVSFAYDSDYHDYFLKNIDLSIRSGETIGITGPVASGKTTLISLILRFYDPNKGKVLIDGTDVTTFSEEDLRTRIALVPQRPLLFTGTVKENIRWGNEQARDEEVFEAANIAEADDFVRKTASGYDSLIGQGGVNFSGGQKQRLSIARALIRHPEILILDDATSAVDAHTDRLIRKHIRHLDRGMTCLIISQRITSIMDADRIIVMDEGKIAAIGTHQQLLEESPYYRAMRDAQLGKGVAGDG